MAQYTLISLDSPIIDYGLEFRVYDLKFRV